MRGLKQPVQLTYFYQKQDPAGRGAATIVQLLARLNPRLEVDAVDSDQHPALANQLGVQVYNTASHWSQAEAARQDGWNKIGILYNYNVGYHTDIHVFDGYFGNTGWSGLATLESMRCPALPIASATV